MKPKKMSKEELVEMLAENAVDGMDMQALMEYAKDKLAEWYMKKPMKVLLEFAERECLEVVEERDEENVVHS